MVAKGTWVNTSFELLLYGLLGWWIHAGTEGAAAAIVVLMLALYFGVRLALMLLTFALAQRHWLRPPTAHRQGWIGHVRVFLGEYLVSLLVFGLLQPCRPLFDRPAEAPSPEGTQPVLLVHGFLCNSAVWWATRRYLRAHGVGGLYTITLEPILNDIDRFAEQLAERVDAVLRQTGGTQLVLVGHSMGGLVARAYIERLGGAAKVSRLITLGAPHHGTALGTLLRGVNVQQMRRDSDWLRRLNDQSEASPSTPVTAVMSWQDNVVVPQPTARLSAAVNLEVSGMGHLAMLFTEPCQALLLKEIRAARGLVPGASIPSDK